MGLKSSPRTSSSPRKAGSCPASQVGNDEAMPAPERQQGQLPLGQAPVSNGRGVSQREPPAPALPLRGPKWPKCAQEAQSPAPCAAALRCAYSRSVFE